MTIDECIESLKLLQNSVCDKLQDAIEKLEKLETEPEVRRTNGCSRQ